MITRAAPRLVNIGARAEEEDVEDVAAAVLLPPAPASAAVVANLDDNWKRRRQRAECLAAAGERSAAIRIMTGGWGMRSFGYMDGPFKGTNCCNARCRSRCCQSIVGKDRGRQGN